MENLNVDFTTILVDHYSYSDNRKILIDMFGSNEILKHQMSVQKTKTN